MTTHNSGIEALDPLVVLDTAEETGGEFVRFELTLHPGESADERESGLSHRPWSIDFPTEHVHPHQEERWTVLAGGLGVDVGGDEEVLSEGDAVALPAGVPHRIWNPLDRPSRVILEFHPALEAQSLTETLYVLAQIGETNGKGQLKLLQFAVIQSAHSGHLYLTAVPTSVQRILTALLAPFGRRLGYRARHPLESLTADR